MKSAYRRELKHNHYVLEDNTGGYALFLEKGSRLLELVPAGTTESAVWVSPEALKQDTWNIGGERTWISPELDYFRDESGVYRVPPQLDPGTYSMSLLKEDGVVRSEQICSLPRHSDGIRVDIHLEHTYQLIANPFDMDSSFADTELSRVPYIGYQRTIKLAWQSKQPSDALPALNLWSILQVPSGGTVLVPVYGDGRPLVMSSQSSPPETEVRGHYTKFSFSGPSRFKLSFHSLQSTGRFGYFRRIDRNTCCLTVRQFQVNPSGLYPDYPAHQPNYAGSCMQFFYDGGQMGGYGELEHHTPSQSDNTVTRTYDQSRLYYFVGDYEQITSIAYHLLGIPLS